MNTKLRLIPIVVCLVLLAPLAGAASAQFTKLVQRIPSSANMIILFNAQKVMNSEVALREGWRTSFEKAIAAGLTQLPADTQQYVLAAQNDYAYMQPVWQLGILATKDKHNMAELARKRHAAQDTISGLSAVLLPNDEYLVQFDANTYAALVPAEPSGSCSLDQGNGQWQTEFFTIHSGSDWVFGRGGYRDHHGDGSDGRAGANPCHSAAQGV